MVVRDRRSDEALLASAFQDEAALAEFYRRYERPIVAFLVRAVGSGELAADLTAEVFAQALSSVERFDPSIGTAAGWLFGIARHVLGRSRERGQVEDRARERLGMPPLALDDELIERIEATAGDPVVLELLEALPADQRYAIQARVVDERGYGDIAEELHCSESVVRKRVSRALTTLRTKMKESQ
jgi:RNA polymerase sigma factor (sigma-70 family)